MTTVNTSAKFSGLGKFRYTGTQEDRELQFYKANGATSNSLSDAENQFLTVKGFTIGSVDDKWTSYLLSLGYTGSKDDMIYSWWNNFPAATINLDFTKQTLDPRITFTRSTAATFINSNGLIQSAAINEPRFTYNPTTLILQGLLIEEQRTNLLLNSSIDGANLSTQAVVTTAVSTTLSFYGTGQIVLSGSASATVVGTGAYPSRKTFTFTPTVGVLTLTVTGTVQYAQLETGAFATSYIPTAASQMTRTADNAVMTGTNFSSWYNQSEGTLFVDAVSNGGTVYTQIGVGNVSDNRVSFYSASPNFAVVSGSTTSATLGSTTLSNGTLAKLAGAYKVNDFALSINGGTVLTDTSGAVATPTSLLIGSRNSASPSNHLNGTIKRIAYYNRRLSNTELQGITS